VDSLREFDTELPSYELRGTTRSLVTFTPAMFEMLAELEVAAAHDVTVLLIGETGSGKTHLARLIHELSHRSQERFCTVACGALPPDLIESELFGHIRGAFTGAERDKAGKFAAAGHGTLLLDEIDVLPLDHQAKLLRVLETGEYEPVGSNDTAHNAARLIVASNFDLEELVAENRFRVDLYYRLNVLKFHLLPLRERPRDIEFLARQFVARHTVEHSIDLSEVTADFFEALGAYGWPGNIRELDNVVRRAVLYCREGVLTAESLPSALRAAGGIVGFVGEERRRGSRLELRVGTHERRIIEESLAQHHQHRGATARALGISRVTLYNKMKKFGLLR
jgi:transcriptional regulator with PAS, ATPase and Fis domain